MGRILVIGGYGLIGSACMRALRDAGHDVVGMGRSRIAAQRLGPGFEWIIRDITTASEADWQSILFRTDAVVNAAGALQDGASDDLEAIHVTSVRRLVAASARLPVRIVQISAAGAEPSASTAFFRTKASGDAAIATQAANWVILRPVLVLSAEAYGGTALLRSAAALPLIAPIILRNASVQTVHVEDVAKAVVLAVNNAVPSGTIADLAEASTRSFPDLLVAIRAWLGYPPARFHPVLPNAVLKAVAKLFDLLGHLGWRSPLRTTAITALADGILGDPAPWAKVTDMVCRPLNETLASLPVTRQDRFFARAYIAMPFAISTLALFWLFSGFIGLIYARDAASVLAAAGPDSSIALPATIAGSVADIALGIAVLVRRWTRSAALGMVFLSLGYMAASMVLAPALWFDPLGPMAKVLPGTTLALLVWFLGEER